MSYIVKLTCSICENREDPLCIVGGCEFITHPGGGGQPPALTAARTNAYEYSTWDEANDAGRHVAGEQESWDYEVKELDEEDDNGS